MTTRTKYEFTKANALSIAMAVLNSVDDSTISAAIADVLGDKAKEVHTVENLKRRISHEVHITNAVKPRVESVKAKENAKFADTFAAEHADGEPFTLNDICERFEFRNTKGGLSYAKATAVINILIADGRAQKLTPVKGKMVYSIKTA